MEAENQKTIEGAAGMVTNEDRARVRSVAAERAARNKWATAKKTIETQVIKANRKTKRKTIHVLTAADGSVKRKLVKVETI